MGNIVFSDSAEAEVIRNGEVIDPSTDKFTIFQPEKLKAAVDAMVGNKVAADPNLLDRIKIPTGGGNSFSIPGESGWDDATEIHAIIMGFSDHRIYYSKSFNETGGGDQPDCVSDDMETGKGDPGGSCYECPMNEWETAAKGKGKACVSKRLLMLLLPGEMVPIKLDVPATSLQNIYKYFMRLASKGILYRDVVTVFSIEKDRNENNVEYSKIAFKKLGNLNNAQKESALKFSQALNR